MVTGTMCQKDFMCVRDRIEKRGNEEYDRQPNIARRQKVKSVRERYDVEMKYRMAINSLIMQLGVRRCINLGSKGMHKHSYQNVINDSFFKRAHDMK